MKEHPHAWALRLIANGVSASEFESKHEDWDFHAGWSDAGDYAWLSCPEEWQVRRKAKTIKVNGFDVPEPCKEMPEAGNLYAPILFTTSSYVRLGQAGDANTLSQNALKNGVLHTSKEAAAAHGKALLGIDPSKL